MLEVSVETPSPLELQQSLLNVFYLLAPEFAGMDLFLRIIWLVRARRTAIMPTISVIMPLLYHVNDILFSVDLA